MREIQGDLWDFLGRDGTVVLVTTNGDVNRKGLNIMGKGCAKECAQRFPEIPRILGDHIREFGNEPHMMEVNWVGDPAFIWSFPVKRCWWEKADLKLIKRSARTFLEMIRCLENTAKGFDWTFVLPRPGCGGGGLKWEEVRPVLEFLPDNVWVISPRES